MQINEISISNENNPIIEGELGKEIQEINDKFTRCKDQLQKLTQKVQEQLQAMKAEPAQQRMLSGQKGIDLQKDGQPPSFIPFSGAIPVPRGECGIEVFQYQVKGALVSRTE